MPQPTPYQYLLLISDHVSEQELYVATKTPITEEQIRRFIYRRFKCNEDRWLHGIPLEELTKVYFRGNFRSESELGFRTYPNARWGPYNKYSVDVYHILNLNRYIQQKVRALR